ncbi:hypothetical protein TVNIR_3065 [Thioalkalivibrio nitratireducens DSM 14787]|uniref:Uncharacterized protein n=1 Tax=Thioalkalivibrio nitratireducens (strain DSM 14787 / UNIQEM 213 / ALEN2) TaxID=1255043 RepID=L0E0D0_THIND|nr:hypothetical protein TVNIR_3065 [Thioalkalivibrio nitratireducens DSM 14787]
MGRPQRGGIQRFHGQEAFVTCAWAFSSREGEGFNRSASKWTMPAEIAS